MRLAGKTAIITGAAQGIGHSIAERFAAEGAKLVLVDIQPDIVDFAASLGGVGIVGSVGDQRIVDRLVGTALEHYDRLDILVNNAVAYTERSLHECSDEDWLGTVDLALTSVFRMCRAALKPMMAQGQGSIVNMASINQIVANPRLAAYTASKGAIHALTKQIAVEYGPRGIRCNAISPGLILNARTLQGRSAEDLKADAEAYPVGRCGIPEDVAAATVFLASDEAGFISGVDLPVDGALTCVAPSALVSPKIRAWWGRAPLKFPE